MELNDVYIMAKSIEDSLFEISKKNIHDNVRSNMEVTLYVERTDLERINTELYRQSKKSLEGYESSDEISVTVFGIRFIIKPKEEKN